MSNQAAGNQPTSKHTSENKRPNNALNRNPEALLQEIGAWIEAAAVTSILGRPISASEQKSFEETASASLLERARQAKLVRPTDPEQEAKDREQRIRSKILAAGIPPSMVDANFDRTETGRPLIILEARSIPGQQKKDPGNRRAHDLCRQFTELWAPDWKARYSGLVLASPGKGPGKTYLMYAVIAQLIRRRGAKCLVMKTGDMLDRYRESYRSKGGTGQSALQIFEEYAKAQVLLIDDLGAETIRSDESGDWAREQFFKLLDFRYERRMTTLATTNLTRRELAQHYGERTVSRLLGLCAYVEMDGPDYRQDDIDANDEDVNPFAQIG